MQQSLPRAAETWVNYELNQGGGAKFAYRSNHSSAKCRLRERSYNRELPTIDTHVFAAKTTKGNR